jgi:hypothetical protein
MGSESSLRSYPINLCGLCKGGAREVHPSQPFFRQKHNGVTPEHVHVLLSEPQKGDPSRVVQAIKQGFARHVAGGPG